MVENPIAPQNSGSPRQPFHRWLAALSVLSLCLSGATCPRHFRAPPTVTAPVVFFAEPSLDDIIEVVNANTQRIRQLQVTDATLSMPGQGVPDLRASLALERPRRLRIIAGTRLTGTELDMGSNDEIFWLWIKRDQPQAIYYAYHHQYSPELMSRILPIPPHWLIETLGLVELDRGVAYQGPTSLGDGRLELRYTADGLTKVLVLDDQRGHILQQQVYDSRGQLLASAAASNFQYDPVNVASLPRRVEISLPPAGLAFSLEAENFLINQLYADPAQQWAMPTIEGAPPVDLATMPPQPQVGVSRSTVRNQNRSAADSPTSCLVPKFWWKRAQGRR